jgi:hypothetical protein
VQVAVDEGPLGWLHSRGHISDRQFEAGDRLRQDYETAAIGPRTTMDWSDQKRGKAPRGPLAHHHATEVQVGAKARFDAACAAVGRGLVDVLWRAVCHGEGLTDVERGLGWPSRSAKLVLTIALDRLGDHYRLPEDHIWAK